MPGRRRKLRPPNLDIVVKDEVAMDRVTLLAAAVIGNVGRRDFDVIAEAKARRTPDR
ncbi:hypothetical protein [Rhodococcus sp. ACS1]|uniref:hypothetical protein n=1 Tax=Rhodococcus sp. ACS1 TaxID=2028570 RepID=UPI0027BA5C3B|nr:hypothetical protein [Rhodococcus sp. ACS1]